MEPSDRELLARYRRGNVDALEILVLRYRRPLFGFLVNMTQSVEESEEVFQEVWLRVIRRLSLYRQKNFLGWLVRIARNIVIDRARRRKPQCSLDEDRGDGRPLVQKVKARGRDPRRELEAGELGGRIAQAVAGLPDNQKEVFVMRMQAGLSFKEIARTQKVSINTALARMQYALAKLRPMLREDYAGLPRCVD